MVSWQARSRPPRRSPCCHRWQVSGDHRGRRARERVLLIRASGHKRVRVAHTERCAERALLRRSPRKAYEPRLTVSALHTGTCPSEVYLVTYLVDGNNVMAQRVGWHRDKAGARQHLLDDLARFARAEGVPVEVVFDGAPDERVPDGSTYRGVRVHYAAPGSDADTRIKQLVDRWPEPHSLVVVTSDRALADFVRRRGVRVIRSGELRRRLDALAAAEAAERQPVARSPRSEPTRERAAPAWPSKVWCARRGP